MLSARSSGAATEAEAWRDHGRVLWTSPGMVVKAAWLPASLGGVLAFVDDVREYGTDVELSGRAALGSGLFRIDGDVSTQRQPCERMRSRPDLFRHVVVLRAMH